MTLMVHASASGNRITFIDLSRTVTGSLSHIFRQLLSNPYVPHKHQELLHFVCRKWWSQLQLI